MLCVRCDICKSAVEDDMSILEVKHGSAGSGVREVLAAHVCKKCWDEKKYGSLLHDFRSAGWQIHGAMPNKVDTNLQGPVAVDPKLAARLGAR